MVGEPQLKESELVTLPRVIWMNKPQFTNSRMICQYCIYTFFCTAPEWPKKSIPVGLIMVQKVIRRSLRDTACSVRRSFIFIRGERLRLGQHELKLNNKQNRNQISKPSFHFLVDAFPPTQPSSSHAQEVCSSASNRVREQY